MLPKKEFNIYPKNEENLSALLSFYFDHYNLPKENAIDNLLSKTSLQLNQIEFIIRKLSESYDSIFKDFLKYQPTVSNLINYGLDALTKDEVNWNGSQSRLKKTKEFLEYVKRTEVDYDFLEKNN